MYSKIKATTFAAKLRKRLAELKSKRQKDLDAHSSAVEQWRKDMETWITAHLKKRVAAINVSALRKCESRYGDGPHFDKSAFFAGAPETPKYPSDEKVRKIQSLLRHIGITGQETVQVSTDEVDALFGDD